MIIVIQIISFTHIEKNYNYIFLKTMDFKDLIVVPKLAPLYHLFEPPNYRTISLCFFHVNVYYMARIIFVDLFDKYLSWYKYRVWLKERKYNLQLYCCSLHITSFRIHFLVICFFSTLFLEALGLWPLLYK